MFSYQNHVYMTVMALIKNMVVFLFTLLNLSGTWLCEGTCLLVSYGRFRLHPIPLGFNELSLINNTESNATLLFHPPTSTVVSLGVCVVG